MNVLLHGSTWRDGHGSIFNFALAGATDGDFITSETVLGCEHLSYDLFDDPWMGMRCYEEGKAPLNRACFLFRINVKDAEAIFRPIIPNKPLPKNLKPRQAEFLLTRAAWFVQRSQKWPVATANGGWVRLGSVLIKVETIAADSFNSAVRTVSGAPEHDPSDSTCRICLERGSDILLRDICSCTGDQRYIHIQCMRDWMRTTIIASDRVTVMKAIHCVVCRTVYPFRIRKSHVVGNKEIHDDRLYPSPVNGSHWLHINHEETFFGVIVDLSDSKNPVTIGRSSISDIPINHGSLSRVHASLSSPSHTKFVKLSGSGPAVLLVKDLGSKFGSGVLMDSPIPIDKTGVGFQIGHHVAHLCQDALLPRGIAEIQDGDVRQRASSPNRRSSGTLGFM